MVGELPGLAAQALNAPQLKRLINRYNVVVTLRGFADPGFRAVPADLSRKSSAIAFNHSRRK
jgi:tetrahydromethanopterin S-methyltransferase subunit D